MKIEKIDIYIVMFFVWLFLAVLSLAYGHRDLAMACFVIANVWIIAYRIVKDLHYRRR